MNSYKAYGAYRNGANKAKQLMIKADKSGDFSKAKRWAGITDKRLKKARSIVDANS
jgi:hypothetical protein